jgi:hypothetical protein
MTDEGHPYAKLRPMWFGEHEPTDFTRDGGPDILRQRPMSIPDESTPIPPALTPAAWSEALHEGGTGLGNASVALIGDTLSIDGNGDAPLVRLRGPDRHALAALALHGQPWGFTAADVNMLHDASTGSPWHAELLALAAKLAALLPPEGTAT